MLRQINDQEKFINKARKFFVAGKLEFDDFSKLKKEYLAVSADLNDELNKVMIKLNHADKQLQVPKPFDKILWGFKNMDVLDKKHIVNFIQPINIGTTGIFSLRVNNALSKIVSYKNNNRGFQEINS